MRRWFTAQRIKWFGHNAREKAWFAAMTAALPVYVPPEKPVRLDVLYGTKRL